MTEAFGVRIFRSRHVPPGKVVIMGDFEKPEGWVEMSQVERIEYAIVHGSVVLVNIDSVIVGETGIYEEDHGREG